jgi:Cu+-exporting ATPase
MTCASCAHNIESALDGKPGIQKVQVNFASKKAMVEYDKNLVAPENIEKIINSAGYEIEEDDKNVHSHQSTVPGNFIWSAVLSLPIFFEMFYKLKTGIDFFNEDLMMWINLILATIVVFYFGRNFHKVALKQAMKFKAGMDTLVSLGTLSAYSYSLFAFFSGKEGYFETAVIIVTLILLGRYFESLSTGKASEAMKKLLEMESKMARIIENGKEKEVLISEVKLGEIFLVKPGEKIPLDGIVIEGSSNVNESMLTGESMPVLKSAGSSVFGATTNEDGILKVKVTKTQNETMLSEIIKTVEEAQLSKAPIQKLADKISGIFVPIIIIISLITFFFWFFAGGVFSLALVNAISVLVIACPCALGLATPTAIMVGSGKGFSKGILFKSGESFEKIKNISTVVFDKTGTITKGTPEVQKVLVNPEYDFSTEKILKISGSLAKNSQHPISKAIFEYAKEKKAGLTDLDKFEEIRGKGVIAYCLEHKVPVAMGNIKLFEEKNIDTKWAEEILQYKYYRTVVFVAHDNKIIGAISVADDVRDEAEKAMLDLRKMGLRLIIITGDNERVAKEIARTVGIKEVFAEVLPAEKSQEIKKLQAQGEKVLFVGDGINDAPSLIQADLGFAMGGGTDIAKEAGQVILMQNDLEKVVEAIKISKATYRVIKKNLFWAFFYNAVAIPLAAFGFLNPMISAGAMSFSSISVVLNSLRIYRMK